MFDVRNKQDRINLIEYIESDSMKGRRYESFRQSEIMSDRCKQFVVSELLKEFSQDTVNEMPVISSINIGKKIVDQEAIIYKESPKREFQGVTDDQESKLQLIYKDGQFNQKLFSSNFNYKYQNQSTLMIIPKDGKLILRVLKNHHFDVIEDPEDPEKGLIYIIHSFSKEDFLDQPESKYSNPTGHQSISESVQSNFLLSQRQKEMRNAKQKIYTIWTKDFNFQIDQEGNVLSEETENPLGVLPFIDIARLKEFEYWVRQGQSLTDFTIQFCARLSELGQVVKMQGFSQAYLSGPANLIPQSIQIGPAYILKLINDEATGSKTEFGFASPNSDIQGSLNYIESILSMFLSTRGVDPKTISAKGESISYSSGIERLLAMIEKHSASKQDFDLFHRIEEQLFVLIKKWMEVLRGTNTLDEKYQMQVLPKDASVSVKFHSPEFILSEAEKLDNAQKKIELGAGSRIKLIMDLENVDRDTAIKMAEQYDLDEILLGGQDAKKTEGINPGETGSLTGI